MTLSEMNLEVTLREDSEWVGIETIMDKEGSCNPLNVKGVIVGFDPDDTLCLRVKWDNGFTNWYAPKDLQRWEV